MCGKMTPNGPLDSTAGPRTACVILQGISKPCLPGLAFAKARRWRVRRPVRQVSLTDTLKHAAPSDIFSKQESGIGGNTAQVFVPNVFIVPISFDWGSGF